MFHYLLYHRDLKMNNMHMYRVHLQDNYDHDFDLRNACLIKKKWNLAR